MSFFNDVYEAVKKIPRGKVTTYGQIARMTGNSRRARQVGWALHANPHFGVVPCHRVVNRFGGLSDAFAFNGKDEQKRLLENEGVFVDGDYVVDLEVHGWDGKIF